MVPALQAEALRSANKPVSQKGWVLFRPQPLLRALGWGVVHA